ncbi:MAG: OadG family protein [Prevotellaceae bacterium]|jgi:Na+-transporting methylmalonyl-CoA/oxaloacetate decarboxylase gamma subunit|nr:OadG family protein [Prevotellaceae bacterium]
MELLSINWTNTFIVVFLGIGLVMCILIILVLLLTGWEKALTSQSEKKQYRVQPTIQPTERQSQPAKKQPENLDFVAIATALSLYLEEPHDFENTVLTFRPQKIRSAWTKFYQYE